MKGEGHVSCPESVIHHKD